MVCSKIQTRLSPESEKSGPSAFENSKSGATLDTSVVLVGSTLPNLRVLNVWPRTTQPSVDVVISLYTDRTITVRISDANILSETV